jgi:hypothetical protein
MAIRAEQERWKRVEAPAPFDTVLMRSGPLPCHIGVAVDRLRMIHIQKGIESVI